MKLLSSLAVLREYFVVTYFSFSNKLSYLLISIAEKILLGFAGSNFSGSSGASEPTSPISSS